jgi:hypothetical protein
VGLALQRVLTVELEVRRLAEPDKRPLWDAELNFVAFDDVDRWEAMAALVFHEVAVGPVQQLCERPKRETPLFPGTSQCGTQPFLGSRHYPARALVLLRQSLLSPADQYAIVAWNVSLFPMGAG